MLLRSSLLILVLSACGSPPPEITTVTVTPGEVPQGGEATLIVSVANFELRDPATHMHSGLRPAHDEGEGNEGEYPDGGHFHVYLDSTDVNPLNVDCPDYCNHAAFNQTVRVTIPLDVQPGTHQLIVRLNNDGHLTLKPAIQGEASLLVTMAN
jgi:hypothetical protein